MDVNLLYVLVILFVLFRRGGGRQWAAALSARSNQDQQRQYEERASRQMRSLLARRAAVCQPKTMQPSGEDGSSSFFVPKTVLNFIFGWKRFRRCLREARSGMAGSQHATGGRLPASDATFVLRESHESEAQMTLKFSICVNSIVLRK